MAWKQLVTGGNWALFIEDQTGAVKVDGSGLHSPVIIPRLDAILLAEAIYLAEVGPDDEAQLPLA